MTKRNFSDCDFEGYFDDDMQQTKKVRHVMVPDDNILIYSRGYDIHFSDGINKMSIQLLIREIDRVIERHNKEFKKKPATITLTIDSPGGSVTSVLKFVDHMNIVKKKHPYITFQSVITGLAASAGTVMALTAHTRCMTEHAYAMIHELSSGNSGQYTHFMSYSQFLTQMHEKLVDLYVKATGKSKKQIEEWLNSETWCSAEEYKQMGFITHIIGE